MAAQGALMPRSICLIPLLVVGCADAPKPTDPLAERLTVFCQQARSALRLVEVGTSVASYRAKLATVVEAYTQIPDPTLAEQSTKQQKAREVVEDLRKLGKWLELLAAMDPKDDPDDPIVGPPRTQVKKLAKRVSKQLDALERSQN
jgi:hypothetical protein